MEILRRLADPVGCFAPEVLQRGRALAARRAVSTPDLHQLGGERVVAAARVQGGAPFPYATDVEADLLDDELTVRSWCSCPVGAGCKHAAAVCVALGTPFARPAAAPARAPLEELLDDLAGLAAPEERPGVGLQLSLLDQGRWSRWGAGPRLALRPVRPGARQRWVRSGLGWGDLPAALRSARFDPAQLRALDRIRRVGAGERLHHDEVVLDDLGPAAPELLRAARDAGVALLPPPGTARVQLAERPLALEVEAVRHDAGTELRVGLRHEGRLWSGAQVTTYGVPASCVVLLDEELLVVAALDPVLPEGPARALTRTEPVRLDEHASDDVPQVLRRLSALVPLASPDDSVVLPEPVVPVLRAEVAWAGAGSATVTWRWRYGDLATVDLGRPLPADVPRDRAGEQAVLARLDPTPEPGAHHLAGADALHLALLRLPVWRATEGVEVHESDAPTFREAQEAPAISFRTEPSAPLGDQDVGASPDGGSPDGEPAAAGTDWLDLRVLVQVDGERVALPDVLAVLTRGDEHLVLPSGLYVRTDHPALVGLQELVQAAGQLHERRDGGDDGGAEGGGGAGGGGDTLRVGVDDLGTWAQVADTGSVDDPQGRAEEWLARARALRDLVDLPDPEPRGVVSTLRPYQREGFRWLAFLWQHRLGGILADDMGLGKTLQVLALVAHARAEQPDAPPFLVVAPTSVVPAWVTEAARHTPGLRVRAVLASRARRGATLEQVADGADVVVTTYTLLRLEADAYAGLSWSGLVLDEAQQVKNHRSKAHAAVRAVPAPFRLAVSGTPFENRLLELWSLLAVVAPGLYPRSARFVEQVVAPVERQGDQAALRRFTRRIRPFVLRRTKELVAADLPPKQEQVLAVELSPRHRRLYDTHLTEERQRILGLVDDLDRHRVAVLAALTRLRQLALDPALVDPGAEEVGSAKTDLLVEHLRELRAEGHRALVFSQFTGFLHRVRDRLDAEGIPSSYLDGTTTDRGRVVADFRAGDTPVFLISLKAGGVGLTLTEADYVFVLDPWWNPAAEAQAVDRAHRIGQRRPVMVYRLVSTDTIEDKVVALKARKAALFAQVVDAGAGGVSDSVTAADIRALFEP